ncbi:MAG: hypothetical protein ACOYI5_05710 [Christensenellales bacterium]|jgi:hypothetical protein
MRKPTVAALFAMLIFFGMVACAEGLPTVSGSAGGAMESATLTDAAAPARGEWSAAAEAIAGADEGALENLRTATAIHAVGLDFNSYAYMSDAEKAAVVVTYLAHGADADSALAYDAEGLAQNNAIVPAGIAPAGDYATVALVDGAWRDMGVFALSDAHLLEEGYCLFDLTGFDVGESPAYLAWHDAAEGVWRVIGLNRAYVELAIAQLF